MSVVTSLTATPNRMKIVWEYVSNIGPAGLKREELLSVLAPPALRHDRSQEEEASGTTIADEVIAELLNLQFLEGIGEVILKVASDSPKGDEAEFLSALEDRLLHSVNAAIYRQGSFPQALSWFLMQSPEKPLQWDRNYREQVLADCGHSTGPLELTNVARWQQFVYWARYLGFAWRLQVADGANVVIPDPTIAIVRHVPAVLAGKTRCSLWNFMSEIAKVLPVLEGGDARSDVESKLPAEKRRPREHLSRSTSFALERLEQSGRVRLERLADADALNLDLGSGLRAVSHITSIAGD